MALSKPPKRQLHLVTENVGQHSIDHPLKKGRPTTKNIENSSLQHTSSTCQPIDSQTNDEICFGMLVDIPILFNPSHSNQSWDFHETGSGKNVLVHLALILREDRCDIQNNGVTIASMNKKTHISLKYASGEKPLKYTGLMYKKKLALEFKATSGSSSSKSTSTLDVLVFGPRSLADIVAKDFSRHLLFFQHPYPMSTDAHYENPQYLDLMGTSFTNGSILPPIMARVAETKPHHDEPNKEEGISTLTMMLENLPNRYYSAEIGIDGRLLTPLLIHQKEAVNFIEHRESSSGRGLDSLWRIEMNNEFSQLQYKHIITGETRSAPEDMPGGILADGMGLGKTLTMISQIVGSLSRAEEFASSMSSAGSLPGRSLTPVKATLIIVPSELLLDGWLDEIEKHVVTGTVIPYKYHGPNRRLRTGQDLAYHIVLSTYGTVSTDFRKGGGVLNSFHWYRLVLDEAHWIKNNSTLYYKAAASLSALNRWCMTGTVIQNSLDDLASLIRFLRVPSLDTSGNFRKHIIKSKKTNTTTSEPDYSNLRLLLRSICFGRNASAVLKIPRVSYKTLRPSFSKAERHAYDKLAISCSQSIKAAVNSPSLGKNSSLVLTGVLRLRIFCNTGLSSHVEGISEDIVEYFQPDEMLSLQEQDGQAILTDFENNELIVEDEPAPGFEQQTMPGLGAQGFAAKEETLPYRIAQPEPMEGINSIDWVPSPGAYPSKIKALLGDVKDHYQQVKCIVFSFWRRSLDLVAQIFSEEGIIFCRVDGETHSSYRKRALREFCDDPSIRVLLMTLGTGAVGLNDLSIASRVHILEPQWNPSVELQAIGRVLRLGQEQEVCVIRYIMEDTLETSIEDRQIMKKELASKGGLQPLNREGSEREKKHAYFLKVSEIIKSTVSELKK